LCLEDYLASLAEGRPPRHGHRDLARHTLALILGSYESAQKGQKIWLT
jgi:hypothetical protein